MIRFYLVCLPYWIFVDYILCGLTSGKQYKKNLYYIRMRLLEG